MPEICPLLPPAGPPDAEAQRIRIILGSTGTGKTYKLRTLLDSETRCFLFDMTGDPLFDSWGISVNRPGDAVRYARRNEFFRIKICPEDPAEFDYLCNFACELGNCTVAVDEMAEFQSPQAIPKGLAKIVRFGRAARPEKNVNGRVAFLGTTQRPPDCNSLLMSQAKTWFIFQMHLPRDVHFLKQFISDVEQVRNLQRGECIEWTPTQLETRKSASLSED